MVVMNKLIDIRDFGVEKIHLGCGKVRLPDWLNVDLNDGDAVDLNENILEIQFAPGTVKEIYACHVIEHLDLAQCIALLTSCYNWLCSGGKLSLAVPDFNAIVQHYLKFNDLIALRGLLLGGGKDVYDIHRSVFDFESLNRLLTAAGFVNISRYDWRGHYVGKNGIDDFSQAYLPHMEKDTGQLMSLNIKGEKF